MQIVEIGFSVLVVPSVSQGIDVLHAAGSAVVSTPSIIGVGCQHIAVGVFYSGYIALSVRKVVACNAGAAFGEVPESNGCACIVIEEIHFIAAPALPYQLVPRIGIVVPCAVVGFTGAKAVFIVLIAYGSSTAGGAGKLFAVFPRHLPAPAVIVADRVSADRIAAYGIS